MPAGLGGHQVASPASKTQVEVVQEETLNVFRMWRAIFDDFTGGAFTKGVRPALDHERIKEWDNLTPDQIDMLRATKGDDWLLRQGAEIDRLRRETEKVVE
jgi:hypothetical protein